MPLLLAPLVFAHRGASGHRPEHTLAAYELAARMGADHLELDLVSTRDGVLVCRHEPELSLTTDVADRPEFAHRRATRVLDGDLPVTGWWVDDFTLAELRTLRARSRRRRDAVYDGRFGIATLQEVIDLAAGLGRTLGRPVGLCLELKHATYFRHAGLPLEPALAVALAANGLDGPGAPVYVQAFESGILRRLHAQLEVPMVQLLGHAHERPYDLLRRGLATTYADMATPAGLDAIAAYACGIGVPKALVVPRAVDQSSLEPTALVGDAHAAGLRVHVYTFRNENRHLPLELRSSEDPDEPGDAIAEYEQFAALGVDGVISDHPDAALEAR